MGIPGGPIRRSGTLKVPLAGFLTFALVAANCTSGIQQPRISASGAVTGGGKRVHALVEYILGLYDKRVSTLSNATAMLDFHCTVALPSNHAGREFICIADTLPPRSKVEGRYDVIVPSSLE